MRYRLFTFLPKLAVLVIASCGFHLDDKTQLSSQLKVLTITSDDPFSPLTRAIHDRLRENDVKIEEDVTRQNITSLCILGSTETRDTISIFQDGTTAEYKMILSVQAQVLLPGKDIYPISVTVFRTFFNNPITALAKDAEQDILRQEMRLQIAEQLVRKLVTIISSDDMRYRQDRAAAISSNNNRQ
ncbi:MAG: LPS assembly lipoprotein LptE [Candidatus Malihini olakiniferum]